jgi:hypothetical protein
MKNTNVFKNLTLLTIVFFVCSLVPKVNAQDVPDVYDAKEFVKKAIKEGKVEIIDCKMEKTTNKDGEQIIKITGTAKYIPAKFRKKPLKDNPVFTGFKAYFYNANGVKQKGILPLSEYGENNQPENVEYKKPFPFIIEGTAGGYFPEETWEKADYCVVRGWNTAKTVSSKDSE